MDLAVEPQWRDRGIGRKLFAGVPWLAPSADGGSLTWSVLNWNEAAIRFYRSLGAEQVHGVDLPGPVRKSLRAPGWRGPVTRIWKQRSTPGGLSQ